VEVTECETASYGYYNPILFSFKFRRFRFKGAEPRLPKRCKKRASKSAYLCTQSRSNQLDPKISSDSLGRSTQGLKRDG
jgi:hypothetical protein